MVLPENKTVPQLIEELKLTTLQLGERIRELTPSGTVSYKVSYPLGQMNSSPLSRFLLGYYRCGENERGLNATDSNTRLVGLEYERRTPTSAEKLVFHIKGSYERTVVIVLTVQPKRVWQRELSIETQEEVSFIGTKAGAVLLAIQEATELLPTSRY